MDKILEEVKTYDTAKLRQELLDNGIKVGPIAPSMKLIFQKRLAKHLFQQQGGVLEEDASESKPQVKEIVKPPIKESCISTVKIKLSDVFYAVCLPEDVDPEIASQVSDQQLVFSDKDIALKTAKKYKGSRFKVFKSENEAQVFSRLTAESAFQSPMKQKPEEPVKKDPGVSSEASVYRAPKPQEIVILRQSIDTGDVKTFKQCVWNNPRYLVSSGDTPVIFQEGSRYTAMHIAAIKNKPEICRAILDILEDHMFISQLVGQSKHAEDMQESRINFLVDLYLNMPDKGNCESPLHMACKFGHEGVVEVLAAHPKTDRLLKNKWGDSPKDVICSRCPTASANTKQKIEILLQGQCYVPLVRSDDNCTQPVIGQPWSPDVTKSPLDVSRTGWSPRDSTLSIKACAGPMSPSHAGLFHKRWTTPPSNSPDKARQYFNTKRSDSEKGLERIGRALANEMDVPWMEFWDFLNSFLNIASVDGLDTLEEYFTKRIWFMFVKQFMDKHGIHQTVEDFSQFSTPIKSVKDTTKKGFNKLFEEQVKDEANKDAAKNEPIEKTKQSPTVSNVGDGVVSPVTGLLQTFAQMKLLDDSWSDKATINTEDKSVLSVESCDGSEHDTDKSDDKTGSTESSTQDDVTKENGAKTDSIELFKEDIVEKENGAKVSATELVAGKESERNKEETNNNVKEKTTKGAIDFKDKNNSVDDEEKCAIKENVNVCDTASKVSDNEKPNVSTEQSLLSKSLHLVKTEEFKRSTSESSDSTASYATAVEENAEQQDLNEVYELCNSVVCIRLKDKTKFEELKNHLAMNTAKGNKNDKLSTELDAENKGNENGVKCLLRLKPSSLKSGQEVDIVSIPELENVNQVLLLRDIEVLQCDGDISSVVEGEVVEIGAGLTGEAGLIGEAGLPTAEEGLGHKGEELSTIQAYFTRSCTLPKIKYIHGPQPTREDLDVSRALGDVFISPEHHPNVFHWKINLSRFISNTNYRWQSPAKLKSHLRSPGPHQPSLLGKTSPAIPYGSPLGLTSTSRIGHAGVATDIRTKLFQTILE